MKGEWKIFLKIPSELILYVDVCRCAEETKNCKAGLAVGAAGSE